MAEGHPKKARKMFTARDIPKITKLFQEAGRSLSKRKFCAAMKTLYSDVISDEEISVLYMKITANSTETMDLDDLVGYLLDKNTTAQNTDYKKQPFPKPFVIIPVDCPHSILRVFFHPFEDNINPECDSLFSRGQLKQYQNGHYLSITFNGLLTIWTDSFEKRNTIALSKIGNVYSKYTNMYVNDMVYMREVKQLAIATAKGELIFYECNRFLDNFTLRHIFTADDHTINTLNYWSNGTKTVLSIGDVGGLLTVFISHNAKKHGLFCREACKKLTSQKYPPISALLTQNSKHFISFKIFILDDICCQIRYCPSLDAFAICGSSSKTMVLATKSPDSKVSKRVFKTDEFFGFFCCVDYSASAERLLTGGKDGLIRVWIPQRDIAEITLRGHVKPITHIMTHPQERIFVSLSEDKIVCVWSESSWVCLQRVQVEDMGMSPISTVYYNLSNNELVLANSDIAKCLGRGTDVFQGTVTSHENPLHGLLYHSLFKQVISACQTGVVTVWDIVTGKSVVEFSVTPDHMRLTAMSLDGPQHRLITASQDGKLRLWNFNNGSELAVLPVTVPNTVTGILCKNDRVFVSQMKSNVFYSLDINGYDNRSLEHHYLKDVSSMDVHRNTLVTASTNGNIVVWNALTSVALFWVSTKTSPRTYIVPKIDQGKIGIVPVVESQRNRSHTVTQSLCKATATLINSNVNASPLVICLKTREVHVNTATLLTSENGNIYAWSVISQGGLLGKFRALKDKRTFITTMSTDVTEKILLTGDSVGRIYLWDIQTFGFKTEEDKGPFEDINGWRVSLCQCLLLASWQGHRSEVVSVHCDPACKYIISGGLDCNILLWTKRGCSIGLFGKDEWDDKISDSQTQISESPRSLSPSPPPLTIDDLQGKPEEAFDPPEAMSEPEAKPRPKPKPEPEPDLLNTSDGEFVAYCRRLLWYRPSLHKTTKKRKDWKQLKPELPQKPSIKQSSSGHVLSAPQEDTLLCQTNTLQHRRSKDVSSIKTIKSGSTRKKRVCLQTRKKCVYLAPVSKSFQTHPKPGQHETPYIRSVLSLSQSSRETQSPYLESKYECVLGVQETGMIKGRLLNFSPPKRIHYKMRPRHTTRIRRYTKTTRSKKHTLLDVKRFLLSLCEQLKPHSPQTQIESGTSQSSPQTASPDLRQPASKEETLSEVQDTVKNILKPCKPKRTQGKRHPPKTLQTRGGISITQSSPETASPDMYQTGSKSVKGSLLKFLPVQRIHSSRHPPKSSHSGLSSKKKEHTLLDIKRLLMVSYQQNDQE